MLSYSYVFLWLFTHWTWHKGCDKKERKKERKRVRKKRKRGSCVSLTYRQQSLAWLVHLQRRARSEGNRQSCFPLVARTEEGGGVPPGERTPRNYRARPVPARRRGDQRRGGRLFQVQAGKTWVPESNHPRRPPSRALSPPPESFFRARLPWATLSSGALPPPTPDARACLLAALPNFSSPCVVFLGSRTLSF